MPAQIVQVDLTQPLPALRVRARYDSVWILVRFGAQPLGWVRCPAPQGKGVIAPDRLAQLISDSLWRQVSDAVRSRASEPLSPRRQPMVSVVVCTHGNPERLARALRSLGRLQYPAFEAIVIDQSAGDDATRAACDAFPFARYFREPRPGLNYARNTGWQVARGEIVAYIDEDTCADPQWLTALVVDFVNDAKTDCVAGLTVAMELETSAQQHFETLARMQHGFVRRIYKPGPRNCAHPPGRGAFRPAVNLALRRSALQRIGGFDVALDAGSIARGGGELDLMTRVSRDGGSIVYDPRALCWHQHRRSIRELHHQMFEQGVGFAAYCMKHARDVELGNASIATFKHWAGAGWSRRLKENLKLALLGRRHFPIHLILIEGWGSLVGLITYRRSVREARQNRLKYTQQKIQPCAGRVAA